MKDVNKLSDKIALQLEAISRQTKNKWKTIVITVWMVLISLILFRQQQALEKMSSQNQVANLRLAVDDIRYSVKAIEEQIEKTDHTMNKLDKTASDVELTVDRIHSQVLSIPKG
jgi:uncharacterized membrane protein YhiD involved in acid resistance